MHYSKKQVTLIFISSYLLFFIIFRFAGILTSGPTQFALDFIFSPIFGILLGALVLLLTISLKRKKTQIALIITTIGIVLSILAFLSPIITGFGGVFNLTTGRNDIPNGFPLSFLKPDSSVQPPTYPPPMGWSPPLKFYPMILLVDLIFWTIVSIAIVFSKKFFCRKK